MGRIDLYEVIRVHYTEFCKSVDPITFVVYLPKLTAFDMDDITTHRTRPNQIFALVRVISAKVKIDDLLYALMDNHLEELAEKLEIEYNRRKPTVRASRFREEQTPEINDPHNNDRPAQNSESVPRSPTQAEPAKKQYTQAISQTDLDDSSNPSVVNNVTNHFHEVNGSVILQNGNHNSVHNSTSCLEGDAPQSNNGSGDEFTVVCEEDDTVNNTNGNDNERAFTSRSQSEQSEDNNCTSPKNGSYEREQNSSSSSRETSLKKSLDNSFTSSTSDISSMQNHSTEAAAFFNVELRDNNNPIESSPSEDNEEETYVKQRYAACSLPTVTARHAEASAGCSGGVAVNNSPSLPNAFNFVSEPLISKIPLVASTKVSSTTNKTLSVISPMASIISNKAAVVATTTAPITTSTIPLVPVTTASMASRVANGDACIPQTAGIATSNPNVQNSRVTCEYVPLNNESNNNTHSLLNNECDVVDLKSSAELNAEAAETQRLSNERRINTEGYANVRTVNQVPSDCSDSFVMSSLTGIENENVQSSEVERGSRMTSEVGRHEAVLDHGNLLINSTTARNSPRRDIARVDPALNSPRVESAGVGNVLPGPRIYNSGEVKYEGRVKTAGRVTLDDLGSNSMRSFEMNSHFDSDNVCDGPTSVQYAASADMNENVVRNSLTLNNLNSASGESFGTHAVNVTDDKVTDGQEVDDKLPVGSSETAPQIVAMSNSITPVHPGFVSSMFKVLLTASLAAQKCTSSSFSLN